MEERRRWFVFGERRVENATEDVLSLRPVHFCLLAGHLLSTAEVESALVEHSAVAEAAVVSHPHPVKGECLYCFVTLRDGHEFTKTLMEELKKQGDYSRPYQALG